MAIPKFKLWEKGVIIGAGFLFAGAIALYLKDLSLSEILFGVEDYSNKTEVGKTGDQVKSIKRKTQESNQFKEISAKTPLYNYDTLVTGPDQSAQILLNDGSTIELGPETMIRLSFESALGLGGIKHLASIEVVSGSVEPKNIVTPFKIKANDVFFEASQKNLKKIQSAPIRKITKLDTGAPKNKIFSYYKPVVPVSTPTPIPVVIATPTPLPTPLPLDGTHLQMISPTHMSTVALNEKTPLTAIPIQLKWSINRPGPGVLVQVRKMGKTPTVITKTIKKLKTQVQTLEFTLSEPGRYEWRIALEKNLKEHKESEFTISPDIKGGITLDPPQTNERIKSSMVQLKWKSIAPATEYRVGAYHAEDRKSVIWNKKSNSSQLSFDLKSVIEKKIDPKVFFDVHAVTPQGFHLNSNTVFIEFAFFNTKPVVPGDNENISVKNLKKDNRKLIFTWEKKNLATAYTFELASDSSFKEIIHRAGTRENYVPMEPLKAGTYFWRIRVAILGIWGPTSNTHSFQMTE